MCTQPPPLAEIRRTQGLKENSQTTLRGHHDTSSKRFNRSGANTSPEHFGQNFDDNSRISAKTDGENQSKIMSNGMNRSANNENKEVRHYAVANPSTGCSDIYARPAELKKSPIPPTPPLRNPGRILAGKERSPDNTSQTDSCDTTSNGYTITSVKMKISKSV